MMGQVCTMSGMDVNVFSRMRAEILWELWLVTSIATAPPRERPYMIWNSGLGISCCYNVGWK